MQFPCIGLSWPLTNRHVLGVAPSTLFTRVYWYFLHWFYWLFVGMRNSNHQFLQQECLLHHCLLYRLASPQQLCPSLKEALVQDPSKQHHPNWIRFFVWSHWTVLFYFDTPIHSLAKTSMYCNSTPLKKGSMEGYGRQTWVNMEMLFLLFFFSILQLIFGSLHDIS